MSLDMRLWRDTGAAWVDVTPPAGALPAPPAGMTGLIDAFLAAVAAGGPAPVAGTEIVRLQRLIDALYAWRS